MRWKNIIILFNCLIVILLNCCGALQINMKTCKTNRHPTILATVLSYIMEFSSIHDKSNNPSWFSAYWSSMSPFLILMIWYPIVFQLIKLSILFLLVKHVWINAWAVSLSKAIAANTKIILYAEYVSAKLHIPITSVTIMVLFLQIYN